MNKLKNYLFWYIGFNTTFFIFRDAFKIVKILYVASIVLLAFFSVFSIFNKLNKLGNQWVIFKLLIFIIALVLSNCYGKEFFTKNLIGSTSIILISAIFMKKLEYEEVDYFIKGYKLSILIDFIYAGVQLIIILVYKININNYLLYYIGSRDEISDRITNRIAGLCWDPYLLGMFCATGFFLFKNKLLRIYIVILLYFTFSRTGQVSFFVAFIYYYFPYIKKRLNYKNVCLLFALLLFIPIIMPTILKKLDFNRGMNRQSAGWRRVEYFQKIPDILALDNNIIISLFGCAPYYSGARFYYSKLDTVTNRMEHTPYWGIECDYSSIILGRGIIGFLVYCIMYLTIIFSCRKRVVKTLALCFFVGGLGYSYDLAIFSNFIVFFTLNWNKSFDKIIDY